MLDSELEAALDRMYESAYYVNEELELWDGPDSPQEGALLWLSPDHNALLYAEPTSFRNIDVFGHVIVLDELDYAKDPQSRWACLLWVKVLSPQGVGWVRGAFLERLP